MRLLLPAAEAGRPIGTGEPLSAEGRPWPQRQDEPAVAAMAAEIAARYAYPAPARPASSRRAVAATPRGPSAQRGRPRVRANMVSSADGAVSVDGRAAGLAGPADRLVFSVLRSLADVILVGAGTARAERYAPVRPGELWRELRQPPPPPIAVLTRRLDLDLDGLLIAGAPGRAPTIVLTTLAAPAERREAAAKTAEVVVIGQDTVTAGAAVAALAARGYAKILCEGGPMVLAQLIAEGILDELCLTISPLLAPGAAGRITRVTPAAGGPAVPPAGLSLEQVIEDGGHLLCRYAVASDPDLP